MSDSRLRQLGADKEDSLDEEELQDLQQLSARRPVQSKAASTERQCGREGFCEIVVPLAVLGLFSIAVVVYNILRFRVVEPCDSEEAQKWAKHFYCFNSSAMPGVHQDSS